MYSLFVSSILHVILSEEELSVFRLAAVEAVMSVQESLIAQLRGSEQGVRGELQSLKRVVTSEGEAQWTRDQALVTAEEKLRSAELGVAAERKRNSELQARCDELASQWDSERKARYAILAAIRPSERDLAACNTLLCFVSFSIICVLIYVCAPIGLQNGGTARCESAPCEA